MHATQSGGITKEVRQAVTGGPAVFQPQPGLPPSHGPGRTSLRNPETQKVRRTPAGSPPEGPRFPQSQAPSLEARLRRFFPPRPPTCRVAAQTARPTKPAAWTTADPRDCAQGLPEGGGAGEHARVRAEDTPPEPRARPGGGCSCVSEPADGPPASPRAGHGRSQEAGRPSPHRRAPRRGTGASSAGHAVPRDAEPP